MRYDLYNYSSDDDKKQLVKLIKKHKKGNLDLEELKNLLFWIKPLSINEFLNTDYIGSLSNMIYPVWREALIDDMFKKGSIINEVILTGSSGTGKTTIALLAQFYNLTKVLSYRVPQFLFNVPETQILAIIFINVSKSGSKLVMLDNFKALLRTSSLYEEVRKKREVETFNYKSGSVIPYYIEKSSVTEYIHFPSNIQVYSGSNISHTLGMNLIGAILDEAEFRRGGVEEALELYTTIKERLRNRFLDMRNWLLILISSIKSTTGAITSYINSLDENDPYIKIYNKKVWEVKEFESYKKGNFAVLVGNKRTPSKILSSGEWEFFKKKSNIPQGCQVLEIPLAYKNDFENNLNRALRNLAGIATDDYELLIDYFECIDNPDNSLLGELYVTSSMFNANPLSVYIESLFDNIKGLKYYMKRATDSLRYIHLDLAETTEAGLCMLHKELSKDNEIIYVVDFLMKITSPDRIDIEKIQEFLHDLAKKYNVRIGIISADQYQSAQILQYCVKHDLALVDTKLQSVVRTLTPYLTLAQIINKNQLRIGKSPNLRRQLASMQIDSSDNLLTNERKDMADALCGALFTAYENRMDRPHFYFKEASITKESISLENDNEILVPL